MARDFDRDPTVWEDAARASYRKNGRDAEKTRAELVRQVNMHSMGTASSAFAVATLRAFDWLRNQGEFRGDSDA